METLRATLPPEVHKLFGYGVALHSGSVLIGNKGSALRLDYGLVGDTVNEAARVEALTKYYGVRLLVTRDALAQFSAQGEKPAARPCHRQRQKRTGGIIRMRKSVHAGEFRGDFAPATKRRSMNTTSAVLPTRKRYSPRSPRNLPTASKTLSARCAELIAHPPANWNGIWKMDAK
jgi:adenylate cyclase